MLLEFHKARLSAAFGSLGLVIRLLAVHPELWDSTFLMVVFRAFGTGAMVGGFFCMALYLIEGVLAMRKVKVEVRKVKEDEKDESKTNVS